MSKLDQFESAEITTEDLEGVAGGLAFSGFTFAKNNAVANLRNTQVAVGFGNTNFAINQIVITQS